MERVFFILIFLGFGVILSTQKARFHAEFTQQKCFIDEIKNLINIEYCSELDVSDNTVRHQGVCTAKNGKVVYTCQHGHWSGTDSSVASLHRKKRFFKRLFRAVACFFFCKSGGESKTVIKYPPSFPEPCKPNDVQSNYNIDAGDDSVAVSWTVPKATDRDGGTPSVTQVGGGRNGGRFDGATYGKTHYITYRATDSDGLTGHCFFSFTVTELTCDSLSWPPNGALTCENKNTLGSSCHYTCNIGHQLIGSSTVTCENKASPSWSAIPACKKITCMEPHFPEHTTAQCSDPEYGFRSVCSMACDIGYTLKGIYFMQCRADGTWSNVGATSCVDDSPPTISCVTPQNFYADRGVTSTSVNWQLPTASDVTDDNPTIVQTFGPTLGAVLEVGTEIVKYKAVDIDGAESQECFIELRIEEIICHHPLDSFTDDYLRVNCSTPSTGYAYGTSCQLSCSAYLPLEGVELITCEDNGQSEGVWSWGSGDKPYCREIACPELKPPINGALVHDSILTRPFRIMNCNEKFDIPDMGNNFNGQFFCTDSGDWTPFSSVPDCIVPKDPQDIKLPAEISYYGGNCGDDATMQQIKDNFQIIIDSRLNPYFAIVCPPEETCIAENIVITCGPIDNRRKRSLSWTLSSRHQENEVPTRHHHIEKRNAETHRLSLEFYIVTHLNLTNKTFSDALTFYNDIQLNVLKPVVQDLISNGTFAIENFVLRNDSFATPNYGDITCDDGYMLDRSTCKPCPLGYLLNSTSNQCEQCTVGQYKDVESESTCKSCPSGYTTQESGSKSQADCVKLCSPGTYSPNTIEICSTCPIGYYQDEYGQTACKQCPSGTTTVSKNSTSPDECKTFDACLSSPCNGHNCTSVQDNYICTCDGGWSGTNCTTPPDNCNGNACENGATCESGATNYTCSCVSGYSGPFCEISPVDGGWSDWTDLACSKTCGTGSMNRTRQCNSPVPDTHGAECVGDAIETKACNTDACPVCVELTSASGTLFNCSTDDTTGSETCSVYCEDGKVLPPGLNGEQSYICGPSTNYEWDYLENPPSCVDPVGPGKVSINITVKYVTAIPASVASDFIDLINNQTSGLQCFDSANCQTNKDIDESTLTIVFKIPTSHGPDIDYSDYISSGIPNGALQEVIDALNRLEQTAQYIQNNTHELFDVTIDGVTYTVADDSLNIDAGVTCNSGFAAYDGICVACPAGTHSIDDVCTFCEKGKYQSNAGQTTCISCPSGQTTNAIGSTDSSQCIEVTTTSASTTTENITTTESITTITQTVKPPSGDNVVTIAIIISVAALVIAIAAIVFVWYKKCRRPTTTIVDCSTVNIRIETAKTRYTRSDRGTQPMSELDADHFRRDSDTCQTSGQQNSQYDRIPSATNMYITPDNISLRCYSAPPPYEADVPEYTEKDMTSVDDTYDVINDNPPITKL